MKNFPNCINCGKRLTSYSYQRCRKCEGINRRTLKVYNNCIDCNKQLTNNKVMRCKSCENKRRFKIGIFKYYCPEKTRLKISKTIIQSFKIWRKSWNKGVPRPKEVRRKISLTKGGTGIPYENSEYGLEFDSGLKERVRQRDDYKCQLCGCSQVENGRQLDCHHIDYNKQNNNIDNLIVLCHPCHMKTNKNRKDWQIILTRKEEV